MNPKLKQKQLARLREDRLTRHICPGISTEDFILAWLYRHSAELRRMVFELKPRYMTTPSGRALCRHLEQARTQGYFLSLEDLDRFYIAQAKDHPKRAREIQLIRAHIARLKRSKSVRITTPMARDIIHSWCKERLKALHPNRRLPTVELEGAFKRTRKKLAVIDQKLKSLAKRQQRLLKTRKKLEYCFTGIFDELGLRADRQIDLDDVREVLRLPPRAVGLRERLLYRVHHGPFGFGPAAEEEYDPGEEEMPA